MKIAVGGRQRGIVPRARALQRRLPAGHLRQRCDAARVPHRRAHEVQERLQVQGNCYFTYKPKSVGTMGYAMLHQILPDLPG